MTLSTQPAVSSRLPRSRRRNAIILSIKALVSLAIVWFLATKVEFETLSSKLTAEALAFVVIGISVGVTMMVLTAVRWSRIHRCIRAPVHFSFAVPAVMEGYALNLALPGSVGGDIVRVARAARLCGKIRESIMAAMIDRGGNLSAQMITCLSALPFLHAVTASLDLQVAVILVTSCVAMGVIAVYFSPLLLGRIRLKSVRIVRELVRAGFILHRILHFPGTVAEIAVYSLLLQAMNVIMLWMAVLAVGHQSIPLPAMMVAASFGIIGSALPVSFGGLGVREGAVVWVLLEIGMVEAEAIMIAIVFGGMVLSQAIPGLFIWAFGRLPPILNTPKS
jgi:uncharacterized membrane protein YbhN (UPF0104 family)